MPAMKAPMPEVAFCAKEREAKNRPSSRRPVDIWLCSTMSASMEDCTTPNSTITATLTTAWIQMIGNSSGWPFSGNQPASRNSTGAAEKTI